MKWYLHSMRDERSPVNLSDGLPQPRDHLMVVHVEVRSTSMQRPALPCGNAVASQSGKKLGVASCLCVSFGSMPD